MAQQNLGYDDTPFIPGSPWRVHDSTRRQPRIVIPGTACGSKSPGIAPSDAIVLFDGTDLSKWESLDGAAAKWKVKGGYMEVDPSSGNIRTKESLGDCQIHLEWAAPDVIEGESQGRGNSGVFLMCRYEIQVLDCWNNPTYADGTTAALYGEYPPLVNACRRPGEWQTYDIVWVAPRFKGTELASPARVTLFHNGIVVHHDQVLFAPTGHRAILKYEAHPPEEPLMLQDHRNPVRFRNIWYRPLKGYDE